MVNKIYKELDDKAWLKEQRKLKSCAQIAREIGCHHFSVSYACRVFTPEESKDFKQERRRVR